MSLYEVKRLNLGAGDHFIVMNPDKTIHSDHLTRSAAERKARELDHHLRGICEHYVRTGSRCTLARQE